MMAREWCTWVLASSLGLFVAAGCSDETPSQNAAPEALPACWTGPTEGPSYGARNGVAWEELARTAGSADDGAFYMLNLIQFRETACYRDGRESDLTGREANDRYNALPHLLEIGAAPVFVGNGETTLLGDGEAWDQVAIVRYPSRELFLSMASDPAFEAQLVHKDAGVGKSIVMMADLLPSQLPEEFEPAESPYPATADDPPVDMIHVIEFRDEADYGEGSDEPSRTGEEAVHLYSMSATETAMELGVYPVAWFQVVDVLVGDGRDWDQLRINHMPSHAAFNALVADPRRQAGQHHREAGIEDTYSVLVAPLIDSLNRFD